MVSCHRLLAFTPMRILLIVLFLVLYGFLTFHMAGLQQYCMTPREIASQIRRFEMEEAGFLARSSINITDYEEFKMAPNPRRGIQRPKKIGKELPETNFGKPVTTEKLRVFFPNDVRPQSALLNQSYAPNTVYFIWCGSRWFQFQHYLSVMSVIRHLRPDNIVFGYEYYPVVDVWTYNTWFSEILQNYPFFRAQPLEVEEKACDGPGKPNLQFVFNVLTSRGGMFVHEHVILAKFPVEYLANDVISALDVTTSVGILMTKRGYPGVRTIADLLGDPAVKSQTLRCETAENFIGAKRKPWCATTSDGSLFPKDIWELDNSFGRLARTIFYGTPKILRPVPTYDELIPNIAHIVWLGGGSMDFLFYLCVLSLINVAKVDMVYIHGDAPPRGFYWNLVKDNNKIQLIFREWPQSVYGSTIKVVSHVTDVWRVDFMIKYGGIYVDTDTVFIKPLDRYIRGFDAVGSYDWTYWNPPYPDTINFGVALGKRNAKYWHLFQDSMKWFMDQDWSWNGLRQPYRIQERHPELVRVDPHLQIICYLSKCHPTWWPDYHNESIDHLNSKSITNWKNDTYAFHWTLPTPYELTNYTTLLTTDTMFSDVGKYVLKESGMEFFFTNLVKQEGKLTKSPGS